jgi:SAM-dependent methyltransferase
MSMTDTSPEFDLFAGDYDTALGKGLALSGEDRDFFARGRMHWLARRLAHLDESPAAALDFGCGTGGATPHFFDVLGVEHLTGLDVSGESVAVAERTFGSPSARYFRCDDYVAASDVDLVFTNGVFHHITPAQRPPALKQIHDALRPGGLFAFWENNPWNPGTRLIMSRIPFDRDAQMVWPGQARRLLRETGFTILLTDFAFIFPHLLRWLRPLERRLCKLPLGGQYLILARK